MQSAYFRFLHWRFCLGLSESSTFYPVQPFGVCACVIRCGNTDPCALTGTLVDTTAGAGMIELNNSPDPATCVWYIQCPGLTSPRLTNFHIDPGLTVTVNDGIVGVDGSEAPILASMTGSDGDQGELGVLQATTRSMTVSQESEQQSPGDSQAGVRFSGVWFCQ